MTTTKFHSLKKSFPTPLRLLVRPMLIAALGLHALLLFTPLPSQEKLKKSDDKETPVKITQLPTAKPAAPKPRPKPAVPRVSRPKTTPPVTPPSVTAKPAAPAANAQQTAAKDPFADFPHYNPATPDCFGKGLGDNCRIASAKLSVLESYFEKALPAKKYSITPEGGDSEAKFYQVSKGDKSAYLSLLSDGSTTVYVLAAEKVTSLKDLKGAIIVPPELYQLLADIPPPNSNDPAATNNARPSDFKQPELFFKSAADADAVPETLPAIDGSPKLAVGEEPEYFYQTFFEQPLKDIFDSVTKVGEYGGGPLYQMKKGSFTGYLSLVPAEGQVASVVTVWRKDPR